MAAVNHFYDEDLTARTHTGDTDWTFVTGMPTISGLLANTTYLVVAQAIFNGSNNNQTFGCRIKTDDDATMTGKSEMRIEPGSTSAVKGMDFFFVHEFSTDGTADNVEMQIKTFHVDHTVQIDQMSIRILDLDDYGSGNYFSTISADDSVEYTTSLSDEFTIAGSNLGTDEFWVMGYQKSDIGKTNESYQVEVHAANDSATSTVRGRSDDEGEDNAEMRIFGFALRHKASSGTPDIAVKTNQDTTGTNTLNRGGYAIALKTSALVSGGFQHDYTEAQTTVTTEATVATITAYSPSVTADHWFFGSVTQDVGATTPSGQLHIEDDTVEMRTGDQPTEHTNIFDASSEIIIHVGHETNILSSDTSTYTLRAADTIATGFRWFLIVSLEKVAGGAGSASPATIARSSLSNALRSDDLPTFGLPKITTFSASPTSGIGIFLGS